MSEGGSSKEAPFAHEQLLPRLINEVLTSCSNAGVGASRLGPWGQESTKAQELVSICVAKPYFELALLGPSFSIACWPPLTGATKALGRRASALAGPAESRVGLARQAARAFRHAGSIAWETVRRSMEKGKLASPMHHRLRVGALLRCVPFPCAPIHNYPKHTAHIRVGDRHPGFLVPRRSRGQQVACTCKCVKASRTPSVGR